MKANIIELIKIQQEVNKKVNEKLQEAPEGDDYLLAFNTELFEYFNTIGTWKWWKHNHEINRENVLDELADCFAFFLSVIDYENELALFSGREDFLENVQDDINSLLGTLTAHQEEHKYEVYEIINDLIKYIGTDNEIEPIITVQRFAIAIFISMLLFEGITWEEITDAYRKKSKVNIQRQVENY